MSEMQFKVTLRGYEREAVDSYVYKLKADHKLELTAEAAKAESLQKEKETMLTQLQEGETLRGEMQTAMTGAQEFINSQAAKLKIAERELDDARKKNALYLDKQEALTKLLADAQIKCSKLVEEAEEHSRHIVTDAEQQREAILQDAQQRADHIKAESKKDADILQSVLRERFCTITDTVSAIRQLTQQVAACCDAADQMIAEPDSFFDSEEVPATV